MNTLATTPRNLLIHTIGATIVVAALLAGAFLGRLSSPAAPAHADTVEAEPTACVGCTISNGIGSGGNTTQTPPLGVASGKGSIGN